MRTFLDEDGSLWQVDVAERPGGDYKGRFHLMLRPDGEDGQGLELPEVRWNSRYTAERTVRTMSDVELRRRLRSALGRMGSGVPA